MGARIAAALAAGTSGQCGPQVLIEPPLSGPGRRPYPTTLEQLLDAIRTSRADAALDPLRRLNPRWSDEQVALRAVWHQTCDEETIAASHRGFHEEDFFAYWRELMPPLLFVYGAESPVVQSEDIAELKRVNPHAVFASIPFAGHMLPWDNHGELLRVVRGWIQALQLTHAR